MRMIVAFKKTAQVRHLGHLDLMRAMQRALRRSGIPIRYSQGFNPHVVLSFASPLPVGASGSAELMDVALDAEMEEGAFSSMLVTALPESLPLVRVRAVEERHPKLMARLKTATYEATFPANAASISMIEAIPAFLDRNAVLAIRKTKRGEHPCDIRPMLHSLEAERQEGDAVLFRFRTSQTELQTLKPSLLLSTLAREAACEMPDGMRLHRSCLYGEREDGTPVPLMEME